jgi:MIP family channel proteins
MNPRALIAEAIGTFILVGGGSLAIVSAVDGVGLPPLLTVPFGFGLALMAAIAIFGHVSGGHFNPAVTLAAWLDRRVDWANAIGYVVAQLIGAVAGSFLVLLIFAKDQVDHTRNVPAEGVISDIQAFAIEAIFTAIFLAVILTITRKQPAQGVFVIPLTLAFIHFAAIPISGASVNPWRSLAPAIVVGNYSHLWVYLTAPFLGALVGWGIYRVMTPPDDEVSVEMELDDEDYDLEDEDEEDGSEIVA